MAHSSLQRIRAMATTPIDEQADGTFRPENYIGTPGELLSIFDVNGNAKELRIADGITVNGVSYQKQEPTE